MQEEAWDDLPSWFHGKVSRQDAIGILRADGEEEGSFLVRCSSKDSGFVLTTCSQGRIAHYQIKQEQTEEAGS